MHLNIERKPHDILKYKLVYTMPWLIISIYTTFDCSSSIFKSPMGLV